MQTDNSIRQETPGEERTQVLVFLAFLSSEACYAACRPALAPEKLAFALCRLWFDELYTPGLRYLDSLKGDVSQEAVDRFMDAFSDDERAALERFHRFLELRLDRLSAENRRQGVFPQNDTWFNIMRDAGYLLETFDADPDLTRRRLAWLVQRLLQQEQPLSDPLLRAPLLLPDGNANGNDRRSTC